MEIGDKTQIWHFSHIMSGAKIGEKCNIGQNVFIGAGVTLGNNIKVQNNVSVFDGVILEDDVFCGPSMVFTNVFNPRSFISRKKEFRKTLVKKRGDDRRQCDGDMRIYDRSVRLDRRRDRRDQGCPGLCSGLWESRKSEGMGLSVRCSIVFQGKKARPVRHAAKSMKKTMRGLGSSRG